MLMLATSAADWTSALIAVFLFTLSLISALIAYIVRDIRKTIDRNARHLDSTITTMWVLNWRVTTVEDFLEQRDGYHPPRIVNRPDR